MKRLLTIGLALTLGLAGAATAQTTSMQSSRMSPNGAVHTTTRTVGPGGTAATKVVDRPNGTRVVTRSRTDWRGDRVTRRHRVGTHRTRVCKVHWRHHRKVRTCTWKYNNGRHNGWRR